MAKSDTIVTGTTELLGSREDVRGQRRLSLLDRVGWYSILVLVIGTAVIVGYVGFITFLWMANADNFIWFSIVRAGWFTRCITISSLILRFTVAAQAVVATSMAAALYLNGLQVSLTDVVAVSLIRFTNTGPRSLLQHSTFHLRPRSLLLSGMVALMSISTAFLQWTSTVLLSDVAVGNITITQSLSNLSYGLGPSPYTMQIQSTSFLGTKPLVYPSFAEYTEPPVQSDDFKETGLSIRAFLPFDRQEDRQNLRNYSGKATLLDTRVVCMRPTFSALNLTVSNGAPEIRGRVSGSSLPPRFNRTQFTNATSFDCVWARQGIFELQYKSVSEWPLVMCRVLATNLAMISQFDPLIRATSGAAPDGEAWLLFNSTGSFSQWSEVGNTRTTIPVTTIGAFDVWTDLRTEFPGLALQATLCYSTLKVQDTTVGIHKSSDVPPEAVLGWYNRTSTFDTLAIRRQLGATQIQNDPRNVFTLDKRSSWELKDDRPPTYPEVISSYAFSAITTTNEPVMLCAFCQPGGKIRTHPVHSAMVGHILQETANPALAIQAFITTMFSMAYNDRVFQFSEPSSAEIRTDIAVIKPRGHRLFYIVMTFVALHLLLVICLTVMFVLMDRSSLLRSAWNAAAQLKSQNLEEYLDVAKTENDSRMKKIIKENGDANTLVTIRDGQILLRRR